MIAQWENKVMSSMLLFLDHEVCSKGQAFTNVFAAPFYSIEGKYGTWPYNASTNIEMHTYALPYKQIIIDESITNANIMKGVHVDGAYTAPGNNYLDWILHHKGQVHFQNDMGNSVITGDVAVKDYNIFISTKTEEDLLINTKYQLHPRMSQTAEGIPEHSEPYPAIFLKNMGGTNVGLCLGNRTHLIKTMVRAVIMSDSAFSLDAVCNILKNTTEKKVQIMRDNLPFNSIGGFTGVIYDYESEASVSTEHARIWDVNVSKLNPNSPELRNLHAKE